MLYTAQYPIMDSVSAGRDEDVKVDDKEDSIFIPVHQPPSVMRNGHGISKNKISQNGYSDFEREFLQFSKYKSEDTNMTSCQIGKSSNLKSETKQKPFSGKVKSRYTTWSGMVLKKYRKQRKALAGFRKNVRFLDTGGESVYSEKRGVSNIRYRSRHTDTMKNLSSNSCVLDSSDHVCSDLSMSEMGSELSGNRGNGYSPFNSSNSCGSPECNVASTSDSRHLTHHMDISSVDSQEDSQDEDIPKYSCLPEQNNNTGSEQDCSCTKPPSSPKSQNSSDTEDYIDVVSLEGDNNIVDIEMVLDQQAKSQPPNRIHDVKNQLNIDINLANAFTAANLSSDECSHSSSHLQTSTVKGKTPVSPVKWQQQFMSFLSTSNLNSDYHHHHHQNDICSKGPSHSSRKKRSRRVRHSVCACCLGGSPGHGKRKRHHSEGDVSYSRRRHSVSGNHKRFIRDMVQLVSLRNKIMKLLRILFPNNLEMECLMNCDTERVDELVDDIIDILRSPDYDAKKLTKGEGDTRMSENCDTRDRLSCDSPDCPQLDSLVDNSIMCDQNVDRDDDEMPVLSMIDCKSDISCPSEEKRPPDKGNYDSPCTETDLKLSESSLQNGGTPDGDLTELDNVLHRFLSHVEETESCNKDNIENKEKVMSTLQVCNDNDQTRKISEADSVLECMSEMDNSVCETEGNYKKSTSETDLLIQNDQGLNEDGMMLDHTRTVSEADSGIGCDPDIPCQDNDGFAKSENPSVKSEHLEIHDEQSLHNHDIDSESSIEAEDSDVKNKNRLLSVSPSENILSPVKEEKGYSDDEKPLLFESVSVNHMVTTEDPFLNNGKVCPDTPLSKSAISSLPGSLSGTPLDKLKVKSESKMNQSNSGFELGIQDVDQSDESYYPTLCHEMAQSLSGVNSNIAASRTIEVFDVGVRLCKKPKVCLKAFKKQLYVLLRWLLPHLQFRNYFFKNIDNLEYLLDTLISCNEPNKLVTDYQQTPTHVVQ